MLVGRNTLKLYQRYIAIYTVKEKENIVKMKTKLYQKV